LSIIRSSEKDTSVSFVKKFEYNRKEKERERKKDKLYFAIINKIIIMLTGFG